MVEPVHNAPMNELRAPLQAQVVHWLVRAGDAVRKGDVVVILEAMKMEHEIRAETEGQVQELLFAPGEAVNLGELLMTMRPGSAAKRGGAKGKGAARASTDSGPPPMAAAV